jgi:putative transcriptional regulator
MKKDFFGHLEFEIKPAECGSIILSEPLMMDPYFKRTVVFITEHGEDGTVGFVLNKSVNLKLNDVVPEFPEIDANIYWGGPVNKNSLFYIHTKGDILEESKEIFKGLYWGGNFEQLKMLIDMKKITTNDIRFFAGYSGWDLGQLNEEIQEKSWIVTSASAQIVLQESDDDLWVQKMKGLGKKFEIMSKFPEDPSLN